MTATSSTRTGHPRAAASSPGETLQQAAARELWEEVGFTGVALARPMWTWVHRFRYQGERITQHETIFVTRIAHALPRGQSENLLLDGIVEGRWWHLQELGAAADDVWPHGLATLLPAVLQESLDPPSRLSPLRPARRHRPDLPHWARDRGRRIIPGVRALALAVAEILQSSGC